MMTKIHIDEQLRNWAEFKNKTQLEIAEYLGMSRGNVGHYFSGRHMPGLNELEKIAESLGISLQQLMFDDPGFPSAPKMEITPSSYAVENEAITFTLEVTIKTKPSN